MVINPSPVALPVHSANLPTESVRNDTRLLQRIPEAKATTESVYLKPRNEETTSPSRSDEPRGDNPAERIGQERQVQEKSGDQRGQSQGESQKESDNSEENAAAKNQQRNADTKIDQLQSRDREVRAHEAAHVAAGGQYAGSATFSFQVGPDGRRYAVGGEVPIDVSIVPNDHLATIRKMQQVRRAALAPAQPSTQDQQVAAQASAKRVEAQAELATERRTERASEPQIRQPSEPADNSPQLRFHQRLKSLGVIETRDPGQRLSVTA